jgi:hypothetical protein
MPIIDFAPGRTYRCGTSVEELRELYRKEDEMNAAEASSDTGAADGPVRLTKGV